jgi:hypothetical protein
MPINTDLNIAPYFDDFDLEKQFYKILFKPAYAVQARELTQLQTILQNQIEQFGDNIYQEGSVIKGCNFTELDSLQFVKLVDKTGFDVESYIGGEDTLTEGGVVKDISVVYELESSTGLKASIVTASRGFETRPPNLNTFYVNYLNTETGGRAVFSAGEALTINKYIYEGSTLRTDLTELNVEQINVTLLSPHVGNSFGVQSTPGIVFQKGHFLFTDDQTLVVSKYDNQPTDVSVGFVVEEQLINALQDGRLYDNANGSLNENAPGADRLKMVPKLAVKSAAEADVDSNFFSLIRYDNGNAVTLRDVTQFNSINEEMAKRTYEESGNYVSDKFKIDLDRRNGTLNALVGKGTAYVKGYRAENVGTRSFEIDNVTETNIQQNQAISIDYGSYVNITDISGRIDINYETVDLQNAGGVSIGSAIVKNITETKLYLFNIKMQSPNVFEAVTRVIGTSGIITIAAGSKVQEFKNSPMVFDSGTNYLKEISDAIIPVRAQTNLTVVSNQVNVQQLPNEDFGINQDDMVFVDDTNTLIGITNYNVTINGSEQFLTVDLDPADGAAGNGTLYYNKRLNADKSIPASKGVKTLYVRNAFVPGTTKYSVGFPDVFKIERILDSTNTDVTNSFRLESNQNDHFYDISYIEYISGRPAPAAGIIEIKLRAFEKVVTSGTHFFNINSYPVDDSDTPAADTVRSIDIETYRATNGKVYNLRNSVDFRPHATIDAAVSYSDTTTGDAGLITTAVGGYTNQFTGNTTVPALRSNVTADLEHYLSRIDAIAVDSYGGMEIIKGKESERPLTPVTDQDKLIIGQIKIPGYPALSPREALESGKVEAGLKLTAKATRNYTMRDIEKIEKRIEGLEYYISLNQLEQESENLLILDENGLTRFKNGYVVDPMNDSDIANINDPNYKAAIHFDKRILTPALNTFMIDLKYKSGTGASIFPSTNDAEIGTLGRNDNIKVIGQPYATSFRNCVSNFWKYQGQAQISPSHDMGIDTIANPTPVEIDLLSPFQELQSLMPVTGVNWGEVVNGRPVVTRAGRTTTTTVPVTQSGIEQVLNVQDGGLNKVGDFLTNVNFNPFMRSRNIKIYASGLRPNTRHYFFFDGVDVNAHVRPGTTDAMDARSVGRFGELEAAVMTDANGVIRAVFTIPSDTFYVGDRTITITDVDSFGAITSGSTSLTAIEYHAYSISQNSSNLSTRVPELSIVDGGATTRNLPSRVSSVTRPEQRDTGDPRTTTDPLSQTFFIKKGMGAGSNSIFVSKVDLYFKRKSNVNGVTIQLREVVNGYPSAEVLPFSKVHIPATEVNVSDDASAITEVTFDAPVRMDVEKEYAVVIIPDANDPNYLHFTSKVGGIDLSPGATNGQSVVMDWGDGVLFTSTNNRAWQSVQDEDIKFTLYRHNFNSATGTIALAPNDLEFFTLSDWDGRFNPGEFVYKEVDATGYTVNMVQNTNVVTTIGNDFRTDYSAGDYILVTNSGNDTSEIFKIASVDSATQMTTTFPTPFNFSNGNGKPVIAGEVSHYNKFTANELHIKESSATLAKRFEAGDTIYGFESGTEATIGSVDNINISYVQPLIQKSNDSITTTEMSGTFTDPNDLSTTYNMPMRFGDNNEFTRKGAVIYSKSNNFINPKSFDINIAMANRSNVTSTPIIDLELSTLIAYQYQATNDAATTSKYISKTVELAEDLDAEDLNLYLTGYRPNGTNIKVYIRPQHAQDNASFNTLPWIELEMTEGVNTYSSSINTSDFREYRYAVPEANKDSLGVIKYTSTAGTFASYRKFAIKIELLAEDIFNVPFVKDYRGIALT